MSGDDVHLPDIRTSEHRRALRERGAPHGDHIQPDEEDETARRHPDRDTVLATILADMREQQRTVQRPAEPPAKPPWSSLPVVLGVVVALISIVGAAAAVLQGYTQLGDRVQSFGERMLGNDNRIALLERDFQTRTHQRDGELADLKSSNTLQDDRMRNFAVALEQERQARMESETDLRRSQAEFRSQQAEFLKMMSDIRIDLKVLVDRAERPHAAFAHPDHEAQAGPGAR